MLPENERKVLAVFAMQGVREVYKATCCGRVYLGNAPPLKCSTCASKPEVTLIPTEA